MGNSLSIADIPVTLANKDDTSTKVEDLLRQVLNCIDDKVVTNRLLHEEESTQEVMLDVWIDGIHYTLTRSYPRTGEPQINLSPREQEIVRLVAKGHPNKVIAAILDISPWTVSTHLRRVFTKLGVNSRAEMVARVYNDDLLVSDV